MSICTEIVVLLPVSPISGLSCCGVVSKSEMMCVGVQRLNRVACTGQSPTQGQAPKAPLLPNSPEDEPIGCRTRTRLPMHHISLDDLDGLLAEEGDTLFDEEGEQYQQFLRVCYETITAQ